MDKNLILLWILLALQVLMVTGSAFVLWKQGTMAARQREILRTVTVEVQTLGRRLDGRMTSFVEENHISFEELRTFLSDVLRQIDAATKDSLARSISKGENSEGSEHQQRSGPRIPRLPAFQPGAGANPEARLEDLLGDSAFLQDLWPRLNGPVDESMPRFMEYLAKNDQAATELLFYPDLGSRGRNHWIFLLARARGPTSSRRFVIPRYFSRYDPSWHAHLFDIRGQKGMVENFVRDLHRCAFLKAIGDIRGNISSELVQKRGIISLTVPEVDS